MHFVTVFLDPSSPIACLILGVVLLGGSTFLLKLGSSAPEQREVCTDLRVSIELQNRKLVPIDRGRVRLPAGMITPVSRVSNA